MVRLHAGGSQALMADAPMNIEIHAIRPRIANVLLERPASGIQQSTVDRSTTGRATAKSDKKL
jgi:hypothetical protein